MSFFFWKLNSKQKFIRVMWTGLLALLFLYWAAWRVGFSWWLPILLTCVYVIEVVYRYRIIEK